jgi:hypothetical protein
MRSTKAEGSSSLKGFWMKSIAPFFMVLTAMGTSPWPVMKTMGRGERRSIRRSCNSRPVMPRHADVHDQAGHFARVVTTEEGFGRIEASDPVVLALQQPLQRVADGFIVVDDIDSPLFWNQAHAVTPESLNASICGLSVTGIQNEKQQPTTS